MNVRDALNKRDLGLIVTDLKKLPDDQFTPKLDSEIGYYKNMQIKDLRDFFYAERDKYDGLTADIVTQFLDTIF
jgi:hypothetical protein